MTVAGVRMFRWMSGVTEKDKMINEYIEVASIIDQM